MILLSFYECAQSECDTVIACFTACEHEGHFCERHRSGDPKAGKEEAE